MAKANGPLLVVIAALVVVGAGAAGWYLFNKETPPPEPTTEAPVVSAPPMTPPPPVPTKPAEHAQVKETEEPAAVEAPAVREYMVDGKLVRDHRPENYAPIDLPPAVHPPHGRKIKAETTSAVAAPYKALMRECVAQIPAEERTGSKPKMESTIAIAVKANTATIIKAAIQLRDVSGPGTEAAKACIEQKAIGLTATVDEADLETYDLTTSFVF